MKKVYIVFWTYVQDTDDDYCQAQTSVEGVYSTEELAKQKIADIANSIEEVEVLSYEDYTSQSITNGYVSSDPELDYSNYLYTMRNTSYSSYYYEEAPVLEQLGE
jgi:glycyl-tRNA synthetase alpha subunit